MDFKQVLVDKVKTNIEEMIKVRGYTLEQAIETAKAESTTGPAVWEIVDAHFENNI